MKEIVVISGKGGTGKTSLTASFAWLGGTQLVTADCDVDAADMHLLLEPDFAFSEPFYSGEIAVIDQDLCTACGKCAEVCRFDAIPHPGGIYRVDSISCEGCGYCARVCPENAVRMVEQNVGDWYRSNIKTGGTMIHARLGIGAENSGKLVAKVKNEAKAEAERTGKQLVLVDGSPGIGCPVVSSLSGANFVVLVTEPSVSGLHDVKRVYELVRTFNIPAGCIINKADVNPQKTEEIKQFLEDQHIAHIADLPYDEAFIQAMTQGEPIAAYNDADAENLKELVRTSWEKILSVMKNSAGEE